MPFDQVFDRHRGPDSVGRYSRGVVKAIAGIAAVLSAVGCGQASPQGLDDLGAKPGFEVLRILPSNPQVQPSAAVQFELRDERDRLVEGPVNWSAAGGSISKTGRYVAGSDPGSYTVTAKSRGTLVTQKVTILEPSSSSPSPGPDPEPRDSSPDPPESDPTPPSSDPQPPESDPTPPSGTSVFRDDFETNDFRQWGGWAPYNDPYASGIGDGGTHVGEGWISSEMAHTGQYAWRAQVDPATPQTRSSWPVGKSSLERWRIVDGVRDFTVSAWYFFPSDFPTGIWSNVMQIKERQSPYTPTAAIVIDRNHKILLYEGNTKSVVKVSSTVIPRGRWVELKTRFVIDHTGGRVTTWLDGKLVLDEGGLNTLGGTTNTNVYFGVGNYLPESTGLARCHIYIDDVRVTR